MDERIDQIARDTNYMRGRVDSHLLSQDAINNRLAQLQEQHGKRIDSLESTRDRFWGAIVASGVGSGSVVAFLAKLFG